MLRQKQSVLCWWSKQKQGLAADRQPEQKGQRQAGKKVITREADWAAEAEQHKDDLPGK